MLRHCSTTQLITADVKRFNERLAYGDYQSQLLVVHGSRLDIIGAVINHHFSVAEEGLYSDHGFQGACQKIKSGPCVLVLRRSHLVSTRRRYRLHGDGQVMDAVAEDPRTPQGVLGAHDARAPRDDRRESALRLPAANCGLLPRPV